MSTEEKTQSDALNSAADRRKLLLTAALLGGLGLLTIAGCLTAPLLNMDDNIQVTENPLLQPGSSWLGIFTTYHYHQYIPVTQLSLRMNAEIFGLETAWAYRLVNWLLHATAAFVLLKTLFRLGVTRSASLLIACIWVVHPMACESVGWVTERSNVLAFFFGMLSFWCYVSRPGWRGLGLSAFLYGLALLSKPLALGWMPIFLALELTGGPARFTKEADDAETPSPKSAWCRLAPFVLLTLALTIHGLAGYQETFRVPPGGTWFTALLTDLALYMRYVFNILLPIRLSSFYAVDAIESLLDPAFWGWLALWGVVLWGTVWLSDSQRRTVFGWLWFFGALGPASNIVAIGYPMQDRYVYLACIGLLLVLSDSCGGAVRRFAALRMALEHSGRVVLALGVLYVVLLGGLAFQRSQLWADAMFVTQDAVQTEPNSALAHAFLARQFDYQAWMARSANPPDDLRSQTLSRRAVSHYGQALTLPDAYLYNPPYARLLLGGSLLHSGDTKGAVTVLTDVLPSPDVERLSVAQPAEERYRIKGGRFEFPYAVPFRQASRAHQWLADAYIRDFREHKLEPAEARNRIASAAQHCEWARQHDPHALQPYFTKAYLFLVEEAFNSAPPAAAQRVSQTILKVAKPYIDQMCTVPEVLAELRHPVPENRPNAMACLAMAAASFDLSVRADSSSEQQRAYVAKTHAWAERALELDPGFSEPHWFLAAVNQRLALVAKDKGYESAAAKFEKEAISRLSNIKPGSPRYERARQILFRYGAHE